MNYSEFAVTAKEASRETTTRVPMLPKPTVRIEFPPNGQRARKVISRSNHLATGKYPSWKMGHSVHYESPHERNAFRLLDACPEVISYREQPCCIHYVMDGINKLHYPDILVELQYGKELLEVKTTSDASSPEVLQRTAFLQSALPPLGFRYRVITDELLAQSPRLDIVKLLLRSGRSAVPIVQREQIRQIFKANSCACWGMFKLGTSGGKYYGHVCRLILEGALHIDFNRPLVDESPLQAGNNFI